MKEESLYYHKKKPAGKLEIQTTKKVESEWDLSLAYSPGVAEPCKEIHKDKRKVFDYTGKGNLVAVVSNGTAVLGLGDIGPLASKPVMEGKAVLFKKFSGINAFDIEIKTKNLEEFIQVCKNLEPTFGGINLEDIASPDCFEIEETLKKEMNIPVFHDDQHGTSIITAAALLNACFLQDKKIGEIKIVFSGAGAAAISCARLLISLGVKKSRIILCDSKGVIYKDRKERMNIYKEEFAIETPYRSLKEVIKDSDVFIGLSQKNVLTKDMIRSMSEKPIVFAMANPDPEIHPEHAKEANPNVIIATGRSDFPNQVNNVLGFPSIFRGALDVQATVINEEMKIAAVMALAELAKKNVPHNVSKAYQGELFQFGSDYIIPKPFDQRVLTRVAPAVAKAAMKSGVAQKPIKDFKAYIQNLESFQSETRGFIRNIINRVKDLNSKKQELPIVLFPEGNSPKILKALNVLIPEQIMEPQLIGDKKEIQKQIKDFNLTHLKDIKIISPKEDSQLEEYAQIFYKQKKDKGISLDESKETLINPNYFASMSVHLNKAQGLVTGATDSFKNSVLPILRVIGSGNRRIVAGVNLVLLKDRVLFFADTSFNINPNAREIADIAIYTSRVAKHFNIEPRIAMLSFTNFTSDKNLDNPKKMREACALVKKWNPEIKIEGEIQADIAVNEDVAHEIFPHFSYKKGANILIFPNLDAGNMAYKLVQQLGPGEVLGPLLMGTKKPVNVLQRTCTIDDVIYTSILTCLKIHIYKELYKD